MKNGRSLLDLAQEITRQQETKRDFVADTRQLMLTDTGRLAVNAEDFDVTGLAHRQIADRLKIPFAYYDRMAKDAPAILATNVNHWFQAKPEPRMIRTLDGKARAFMSNRYARIDNAEILESVLPVLLDQPEMNVVSCEVTETRMYLKALFPRVEAELKRGDVVQAGLVISNSEVGSGAVNVSPLIYRLVCTNGMISEDSRLRKYHIGRANAADGEARELYADDTLAADDKALMLKVRDTVRAVTDGVLFNGIVDRFRASMGDAITGNPVKAVEVLSNKVGLNDGEKDSVLRHLILGGDLSRFGMVNAVTRSAQDVESYDRATELETLGGRILDLPRTDWSVFAEAA